MANCCFNFGKLALTFHGTQTKLERLKKNVALFTYLLKKFPSRIQIPILNADQDTGGKMNADTYGSGSAALENRMLTLLRKIGSSQSFFGGNVRLCDLNLFNLWNRFYRSESGTPQNVLQICNSVEDFFWSVRTGQHLPPSRQRGGGEVYHHHTVLHGVPARQRTVPTLMYTLQPGRNTIQHQLAGAGARGGGGGGTSGVF